MCTCIQNCLHIDYYCPIDEKTNMHCTELISLNELCNNPESYTIIAFATDIPPDLKNTLNVFEPSFEKNLYHPLFVLNDLILSQPLTIVYELIDNRLLLLLKLLSEHTSILQIIRDTEPSPTSHTNILLCTKKWTAWQFQNSNVFIDYYYLHTDLKFIPINSPLDSPTIINYMELQIEYNRGQSLYKDICSVTPKFILHGWTAVGDDCKFASLIHAFKKFHSSDNLTYITYTKRSFFKTLFGLDSIICLEKQDHQALRTFLELNLNLASSTHYYSTDTRLIFPIHLYPPQCDIEFFSSSMCIPRHSLPLHAKSNSNIPPMKCIFVIPNANWMFCPVMDKTGEFRKKTIQFLATLSERYIQNGFTVLINDDGSVPSNIPGERINFTLCELSSLAPLISLAIGPMTGLLELMIFSNCPRIVALSDSANNFVNFDLNRLKDANHMQQIQMCSFYNNTFDSLFSDIESIQQDTVPFNRELFNQSLYENTICNLTQIHPNVLLLGADVDYLSNCISGEKLKCLLKTTNCLSDPSGYGYYRKAMIYLEKKYGICDEKTATVSLLLAIYKNQKWSIDTLKLLKKINCATYKHVLVSTISRFAISEPALLRELSHIYREGIGVTQNLTISSQWMKKAADQNIAWAKTELLTILCMINTNRTDFELIEYSLKEHDSGNDSLVHLLCDMFRHQSSDKV